MLTLLCDDPSWFPPVQSALDEPDGLLAVGGDLSPERLLHAYRQGIFPWFSDDDPMLMWWSPKVRCIVAPMSYQANRTLRKLWRQHPFQFSFNQAFDRVIESCAEPTANRLETWITSEMMSAYKTLHRLGHAHSVEIWHHDKLVGGLYGLQVGNAFCGESMFHRESGASKVAFLALIGRMKQLQMPLLDCQLENPHLMNLGASLLTREDFIVSLKECTACSSIPLATR